MSSRFVEQGLSRSWIIIIMLVIDAGVNVANRVAPSTNQKDRRSTIPRNKNRSDQKDQNLGVLLIY